MGWIKVFEKGKYKAYHICVDCLEPIKDDNTCGCRCFKDGKITKYNESI